jgi:hypothetical protein
MQANTHRSEPDPRRWWASAPLCGALFMAILVAAIVTVAFPSKDLGFSLRWGWSAALLSSSHGGSYPSGRGADFGSIFDSPTASVAVSPTSPKANRRSLPCSPARAGRVGIPQEQVRPSPVPATEGACEE